jgi:hypothetical protein
VWMAGDQSLSDPSEGCYAGSSGQGSAVAVMNQAARLDDCASKAPSRLGPAELRDQSSVIYDLWAQDDVRASGRHPEKSSQS